MYFFYEIVIIKNISMHTTVRPQGGGGAPSRVYLTQAVFVRTILAILLI